MPKRKGVLRPPQLPPDEETDVSDEDFAFVAREKAFARHLSKLDTKSINRHVVRVAGAKEDQLETRYEKQNKKRAVQKLYEEEEDGFHVHRVDALPVKTLDGELHYRTSKDLNSENLSKENESTSELTDELKGKDEGIVRLSKTERRQKLKKLRKEAKNQAKEVVAAKILNGTLHSEVLTEVENDLSAEEQLARKKMRLAELGTTLLENPEENIRSLKELLQICDDKDRHIVKLGLMSLVAVFKDIIPGYRIRLPTEKELQIKVSNEVKKTQFYESTLLRSYKIYLLKLKALEKLASFKHVAVRCLCILLEAVPHFNFRESLLLIVVKNIGAEDIVVRKLCCESIKSLFSNEGKHGGMATLEAVQLIAERVKVENCQIHPDSLEVFLSLTFNEDLCKSELDEEEKKANKKKPKHMKPGKLLTNEKKKMKHELLAKTREEVSSDFKSITFAPDSKEQRKIHSDTLSSVFGTYFRILKRIIDSRVDSQSSHTSEAHPLLSPCLRGLGRFSHLIDLDYMSPLMECLKKLAGYGGHQNPLSVTERLQCCIVAFRVMSSNLDALNVDLHDFFVQLYNLLLEFRHDRDKGEVLAEALQTMLWEGKQNDMQRAASFVKRLATFSLCFGSAEAMAALSTLQHLLLKNSKCRNLLENDAGGGSLSGFVVKYQPDATNPNLSGALASVLWELSLLAKHYDPSIASMASSISSMNSSQNQLSISSAAPPPLQAYNNHSVPQLLSKPPTNKPCTTTRRCDRKGKGEGFVVLSANDVRKIESGIDEEAVKSKFENHFTVLRDISENERLRRELNRTVASIGLYRDYKAQRKQKNGSTKKGKKLKA